MKSNSGQYTHGSNQVAYTTIGETSVSTIWYSNHNGVDRFETLAFREGRAITDRPEVAFNEADAFEEHAKMIRKMTKK